MPRVLAAPAGNGDATGRQTNPTPDLPPSSRPAPRKPTPNALQLRVAHGPKRALPNPRAVPTPILQQLRLRTAFALDPPDGRFGARPVVSSGIAVGRREVAVGAAAPAASHRAADGFSFYLLGKLTPRS